MIKMRMKVIITAITIIGKDGNDLKANHIVKQYTLQQFNKQRCQNGNAILLKDEYPG